MNWTDNIFFFTVCRIVDIIVYENKFFSVAFFGRFCFNIAEIWIFSHIFRPNKSLHLDIMDFFHTDAERVMKVCYCTAFKYLQQYKTKIHLNVSASKPNTDKIFNKYIDSETDNHTPLEC